MMTLQCFTMFDLIVETHLISLGCHLTTKHYILFILIETETKMKYNHENHHCQYHYYRNMKALTLIFKLCKVLSRTYA